jgi:hypothetical protein
METHPQTSSARIPTLLKLTLVPPASVVVGIGIFVLAWDSESEFMLEISMLFMVLGVIATIPALLVATYGARRLAKLTFPELLTVILAVVGNGGVLFATAKAFDWV